MDVGRGIASNQAPLRPASVHVVTRLRAEFLNLQAALAGEYSIERELGRGGMGVVYLAREVQLDRDLAIKVTGLQPSRSVDKSALQL